MSNLNIQENATNGTYVDKHVPRGLQIAFIVFVFALVLLPFVGMLWAPTESTTENRSLAELPSLQLENGSFNENYLKDLGTYFDDHFAYRNSMVDANAHLRALVGVSATDQVVLGADDWLYYGGTLPDYLGQGQLSDRALANIAHNLALAQSYVESRNGTFVFTLAPNKNSLDWSSMPYYYLRYEGASNAERLKPFLEKEGINYVDLFTFFHEQMQFGESFHYLKQDSHWDNYWALLASNEILKALGRTEVQVDPASMIERDDFLGDLQAMLYPDSPTYETNQYYAGFNDGTNDTGSYWEYVLGNDVTESFIRTESTLGDGTAAHAKVSEDTGAASSVEATSSVEVAANAEEATNAEFATTSGTSGSLLMFRDSFGNALLPFFAGSYEKAAFSKLVPYNLTQLNSVEADSVVIERAERHLSYLATNPPILPNPCYEGIVVPSGAREVAASVELTQNGSLWELRGTVERELDPESNLFVIASFPNGQKATFVPFWVSSEQEEGTIDNDNGLLVYASQTSFNLSHASFTVYMC